MQVLTGARGAVIAVAFHPTGTTVATAGVKMAVRLWSVRPPPDRWGGGSARGRGVSGSGTRTVAVSHAAGDGRHTASAEETHTGSLAESHSTLRLLFPCTWSA